MSHFVAHFFCFVLILFFSTFEYLCASFWFCLISLSAYFDVFSFFYTYLNSFSFVCPFLLVLPHFIAFLVEILFRFILVISYFAVFSFFSNLFKLRLILLPIYFGSSSFYCFLRLNSYLAHFGSV